MAKWQVIEQQGVIQIALIGKGGVIHGRKDRRFGTKKAAAEAARAENERVADQIKNSGVSGA